MSPVFFSRGFSIRAFTLVEIMIAVSIFAVMSLALVQLNNLWLKKGKESIQKSDGIQSIATLIYKLRDELRRCKQFDSPAIKITSNRIKFVNNDRIVSYEFLKQSSNGKGVIVREVGLDRQVLISGITNVEFVRLDQKFLQITFELIDQWIITRVYLRQL